MHTTEKRTAFVLHALQEKHSAEYCSKYGEPGYTDPAAGIIFANWNDISRRLGNYLEAAGYECEWSDEWTIDYENDKAYRTSPDWHGWVPQIVYTDDGEMLTPDDGAEAVIEALAMSDHGHPARAVPAWVQVSDIEAAGYTAINGDFESGFHPGQTDDPKKIARAAFDAGATAVIFRIKENSQFYMVFQGYARNEVQS